MAIMLITHDLGVVAEIATDVAVMYLAGWSSRPPWTRSSAPRYTHTPRPSCSRSQACAHGAERPTPIPGAAPNPDDRPPGCPSTRAARWPWRGGASGMPSCACRGRAQREPLPLRSAPRRHVLPPSLPAPTLSGWSVCRSSSDAEGLLPAARRVTSRPSTVSIFTSTTARRWAWSARAAAARPPRPLPSCAPSSRPPANPLPGDGRRGSISAAARLGAAALRRETQMIFQDPFSSLNPRMTLLDIVGEPLLVNGTRAAASLRIASPICCARWACAPSTCGAFPTPSAGAAPAHRHRPGTGAAPRLVVADEPVSALDVSVQAQMFNLLLDLQPDWA